MTYNNPLEIEIPAWGDVFINDSINPDNLAIIDSARPARMLTRQQKAIIKQRRKTLNQVLEAAGYFTGLARYNLIREKHQALKIELHNASPDERKRIRRKRRRYYRAALQIASQLETVKPVAAHLWYLERRAREHQAALEFERHAKADREQMLREVSYFSQRIIERYSQLKFREDVHIDGKHIRYKVRFEQCIVTEDELVLKIDVSRTTVLGSSIARLPDGVRVRDLIKPETLDELSAACERPIWSPHNSPDHGGYNLGFDRGAWLVLSRLDMLHSIPTYIELKHVLAKYRSDESSRFPLPFGVKRGRKINWGYIDNTSPHFMINGLTGSGKTNCIVGCLVTLIQMNSPDEIRLLITDLKHGGDFRPLQNVPHNLLDKIIFTPRDLRDTLQRIAALLYLRQDRIGEIGNDIGQYNRVVEPSERLARVLIVIDEYSETKDFDDKTVKESIDYYVNTIARLGRAAGIHLMIGNQQPYVLNIPSEVKGNITYHLTGFQMTLGASQSTVGNSSATKIEKIPGRMICNTGRDIFEVQQAYVGPDDISAAVAAARHWPVPRPFDWPDSDQVSTIIADNQPGTFDHQKLATVAIEQFNGLLNYRKIYDETKDSHSVSMRTIGQMIKELAGWGEITVNGETYVSKQNGQGWKLERLRDCAIAQPLASAQPARKQRANGNPTLEFMEVETP